MTDYNWNAYRNLNPVSEVQTYLRNIYYSHNQLPPVVITGVYDEQTKKAVKEFQKLTGLPETGKVDLKTWNVLVRENEIHEKTAEMPYKVPCRANDLGTITEGYTGDIVYMIKVMLNNFCRKYKNYNKLQVNDNCDKETVEAIKQFQKASMLPVTGVVDKVTWNTMVSIYGTCKLYNY